MPKDALSLSQPMFRGGTITIDGKDYYLDNQIVIGHDWLIKPVIIEWHIDIMTREELRKIDDEKE